ncbi:MAG TPA: FIST N-terminal domain-containing protein [Desulfobacterales bacterium]|nr:FIST N-terminal domain-containing protein [Desulfobacterales bacterium]
MGDGKMKVGIGSCNEKDGLSSGKKVAEEAIKKGNILRTDFVLAFCNAGLDHDEFFRGLQSVVGSGVPIIGGSAIGVITNDYLSYEGYPSGAAVVQSDTVQYRIAAAGNLDKDEKLAGRKLGERLSDEPADKLLLILYDSIKIPATALTPPVMNASSPLIEGIEEGIKSNIPILGAGVIGDYVFSSTKQFCGSYVGSQSVVGAILGGDFEPYFRIMHGCTPLDGIYHKITRIEGSIIYELDGKPIVEVIDELYGSQNWRQQRPNNFLTIGVNYGDRFEEPEEANYVNRLIAGVLPDGKSIGIFEPDLALGTEIQFMLRDSSRMMESAKRNPAELMAEIKADGKTALFGMYIDCAGRAANSSNTTFEEASEIQDIFNQYNTPLLGFYSGVEVAPLLQKSKGLDWTGVLIVLAR